VKHEICSFSNSGSLSVEISAPSNWRHRSLVAHGASIEAGAAGAAGGSSELLLWTVPTGNIAKAWPMDGLLGVAGMIIDSYCGSFPKFPAKHQ